MSFAIQKAKYDIKVIVRFDLNGGTSISETEKTYTLGQKYKNLPTASKTDQLFLGWFTDSVNGRKITTDDDVNYTISRLYAHFAEMTNFTSFEVTTTSSYKKFGIYSTTLKSGSTSQCIDWGDGTIEEITGNISQKVHEYTNAGTFVVKVSDDITSIAPSYDNNTWYSTTSQNRYTLKKILHFSTSLTFIPAYAYYYCYNMTSVSGIADSNITSLPSSCFYYCWNLANLNGLSKITSIGTYCFYYCYNLTSFTGIGNITSLPNYSFEYCPNITSLNTLPTSVTSYGQYCISNTGISDLSRIRSTDTLNSYCFAYMRSLINISTLAPRSSLPSYCFIGCINLNVADMTNWSSLTSIPSYCFNECTALTSVTFNYNLKNIQSYAFQRCYASNFKNLNLKDTQVTSIGTYAFNYNFNLTSMSLPSTLTYIYDYSFAGCRKLQQISCYATNAPTTYANTFGNTTGAVSNAYVGSAYASSGNNQLHIDDPDKYQTSYWQSVLLDSSKCGFNLVPFDEYDIRGCKIEGLSSGYVYTGEPIVPAISVKKQNGTTLTKDTDYSVSLADNTEIGTASLSVIGMNSYHNVQTKTFKIYDPSAQSIEADLNGQWRIATTKTNPDPVNYDLYESNSNYNVGSAFAKMYVRTEGITDLDLYIGSYAESAYDYTVIFNPDIDVTSNPSTSTTGAKQNTSGFQKSGNNIDSDFRKVTYNLDGNSHYITVCYRKDSSVNSGYDRGYLLIPNVKDPKNLAYARMEGLSTWYLSTGTEIIPEISVYSSAGQILNENVEWSKQLSNNINVGTAGISAIGISPYYGTLQNTFKIVAKAPVLYRYFKLKVDATGGGSSGSSPFKQLSRIEFIDANGNYFVYPSGTTCKKYGNSSLVGTYTTASGENPLQALNHSTAGKLGDNTILPTEYVYDMGSECLDLNIYSRWQWYTANDTASYTSRNLKTFSMHVSNDETNWIQVDSATNYTAPTSNNVLAYTGNITI